MALNNERIWIGFSCVNGEAEVSIWPGETGGLAYPVARDECWQSRQDPLSSVRHILRHGPQYFEGHLSSPPVLQAALDLKKICLVLV